MSIFTDRETRSSINSLSAEVRGSSVSDLFVQIEERVRILFHCLTSLTQ